MPRRTQALHFTEGSAMKNFEKMDDVSYAFVGTRAVITLVVATVLLTAAGCSSAASAPKAAPPLTVTVAEVERRDVPIYSEWIGTLDGFVNSEIKAQVSGYLVKQEYTRGYFRKERATSLSDRPPSIPGGAGTDGRTTGAISRPIGAGPRPVSSGGSASRGGPS